MDPLTNTTIYNDTTAFEMIADTFIHTNVFGVEYIIPFVIVVMTLVLITRNIYKWSILAFPVLVGWHVIGLRNSIILYVLSGIAFVISSMSTEVIGSMATAYDDDSGILGKIFNRNKRKIFKSTAPSRGSSIYNIYAMTDGKKEKVSTEEVKK